MKHLLLIHGAIGSSDQMIPLQELLNKEFEIHLLEFDGHGNKSASEAHFSLEGFAHQLRSKLNEIGAPAHLFGYSMGGFVALWDAAKNNTNIASITTLGTKMEWNEEIAKEESKHLNVEAIEEKVPKFASALERRHGAHWKKLLYRTANFMTQLGEIQPMQAALLAQVDVPVQLCLADNDTMVSLAETERVHQWIKGSTFEVIPGSKHPIEQVDLMALAGTIRSFINRLD